MLALLYCLRNVNLTDESFEEFCLPPARPICAALEWSGLLDFERLGVESRACGAIEAATGIVSAKRLGRDSGLLSYRETRRIIPLHHD